MTHLWLRKGDGTVEDPQSDRIIASDHPWRESDFPPAKRHPDRVTREFRETDVPDEEWTSMMLGSYSPAEQDEIHRQWWDGA